MESNNLNDEIVYTSVGTSSDKSIGGIGMSIGSSDSFTFSEKSKIDIRLKKYLINSYSNTNVLLNDTIVGKIIEVPFINQTKKYPTGCESVSATSVLQYYGIDISVDTFIDNYLPKADLKIIGYDKNNNKILSSEHPNEYFIGNPKSYSGLGCYEKVIANAVNNVLKEYNLEEYFEVASHRDLSISDIENYLDKNIPVIMWATQNMLASENGLKWYLGDSDEVFQYMKNEHCMVAIGYDDNYLYFNDSLVGKIAYPKKLLEDRYTQMGTRTVTIVYIG